MAQKRTSILLQSDLEGLAKFKTSKLKVEQGKEDEMRKSQVLGTVESGESSE